MYLRSIYHRMRLLILLARPPPVFLLVSFATLGIATRGPIEGSLRHIGVMAGVIGYVIAMVAINNLADREIDETNLANEASRPLVSGGADRFEMVVTAWTGAVLSLGASLFLSWPATVVVVVGLLLAAAYSLPPFLISHRGAVASLALPAGFVGVPFLTGVFSSTSSLAYRDLALLGGLWLGFVGRILLKDFRDIRGDLLYGKRTFLIRYGRRATCGFSGLFWVAGSSALLAIREPRPALFLMHGSFTVAALVLLRLLARSDNVKRDEWLISAIAIVGRSMIVGLILHLGAVDQGLSDPVYRTLLAGFLLVTLGQAVSMVQTGPAAPIFGPRISKLVPVAEPTPTAGHPPNNSPQNLPVSADSAASR